MGAQGRPSRHGIVAVRRYDPAPMSDAISDPISITLPDGSEKSVPAGSSAGDLAATIGKKLAKAAVIANVNGTERDLVWPLADGDEVGIVTDQDDRGLYTIRHSTAHVL